MPENNQGVTPQGYQVIFRQLDATPTGTTNTSVANIGSGVLAQNVGNINWANWIEGDANPAVNGSSFKITRRGLYQVEAKVSLLASANLILALTVDTTQLAVAPTSGNVATRDYARVTAPAATLTPVKLSAPILISQSMAGDPALGVIRLLITDEAGLAPPAGELDLPNAMLIITRVSDLRMAS